MKGRENWHGNQEWTIYRHWQNWVHKTQNEDKWKKHKTDEQHRHPKKMGDHEGLMVPVSFKTHSMLVI